MVKLLLLIHMFDFFVYSLCHYDIHNEVIMPLFSKHCLGTRVCLKYKVCYAKLGSITKRLALST